MGNARALPCLSLLQPACIASARGTAAGRTNLGMRVHRLSWERQLGRQDTAAIRLCDVDVTVFRPTVGEVGGRKTLADRKSVVRGKRGAVRVDLGGRRPNKQKKKINNNI